MLKKCEYCDFEFEDCQSSGRPKKYCSEICRGRKRHHIKLNEKEKFGLFKCKQCGKDFKSDKVKRLCSEECSKSYYSYIRKEKIKNGEIKQVRKTYKKVCKLCKKDFETKTKQTIFCSLKCSAQNRPRKIIDIYIGQNHFNDFYLKKWRKQVFERDKYTCRCCGHYKGKTLRAHHIEGWNNNINLRYVINNGITLCNKCHIEFHNIFGYGYNNLKQLEEFLIKRRLTYANTI